MSCSLQTIVLVCGFSYLLGSIPFGFMISKMAGIDNIMAHGSGNIGATNVFRIAGPAYAIPVLILDIGKGALSAYLGLRCLEMGTTGAILAGLLAIIGHNWSLFLRLKGGKGVATTVGVTFVAFPKLFFVVVGVFVLTVLVTKYVSLGSLIGVWTAFLFSLTPQFGWTERIAALVFAVLVTYRHRSNIQRLMTGTESKFGERRAKSRN